MKKLVLALIVLLFPLQVSALSVTGSSAILMDVDSGRVLYKKNIDNKRLIASITKIMTAVIAIENGDLDKEVTAGEEILTMYGTSIYLELGEKMALRDLLYGLLMRSGNDSAVVIATHISGSEKKFVEMMNKKAREIGMSNTIFQNSHGLDEVTQNYSTAYDMALLSSYAYSLDTYREIAKTKKYVTKTDNKSYVWLNRNKLLTSYKYATGGKNGYTPSAGRTLVTNASKNKFNLTAVTLNDPDEYISHKDMYEYGYSNYKRRLIIDKHNFKIDDNFYKDNIYVEDSFYYPLTDEEIEDISIVAEIVKLKNYKDNDKIGKIVVKFKNSEIFSESIFVSIKKQEKGWFKGIGSFFKSLFG